MITGHAWRFCTTASKYINIWQSSVKLKKMPQRLINRSSDISFIPANYRIGNLWVSAQILWISNLPHIPHPKQKKGRKRKWHGSQGNTSWESTGIAWARCVVEHISQSFANTPENSRRLMQLEGYLYMVSLGIMRSHHEIRHLDNSSLDLMPSFWQSS